MSPERAYKNCIRCHELAKPYDLKENCKNDQVYAAMNEAMRALESELHREEIVCQNALEACLHCNFSEPKIARIIEDKIKFDEQKRALGYD